MTSEELAEVAARAIEERGEVEAQLREAYATIARMEPEVRFARAVKRAVEEYPVTSFSDATGGSVRWQNPNGISLVAACRIDEAIECERREGR